MRLAIVHYHLQPGGVTRVIEHAVSALHEADLHIAILTGEPPADESGTRLAAVRVIDELGYDERGVRSSAAVLRERLESAAQEALGGKPDVWHVHNHALGKNRVLPKVIYALAAAGQPLLLQIHDFAEDGRPSNYRRLVDSLGDGSVQRTQTLLYPQAGHVHYAVLNRRDRDFLSAAGVPPTRLHLLPNAVWLKSDESPAAERVPRLWLYPTRAIRRKNLGEFLLWSALAESGERFATTRGPSNPLERPRYERWMAFARELRLPVEFEVGGRWKGSFEALLQRADALVTTSVAEGFGLAFLEPWLVGRPLAGRDLPEITTEFRAAGVNLGGLYPRLSVPLDWIGQAALEQKIRTALQSWFDAYGRRMTPDAVQRSLGATLTDGQVDFGRLDEPLQESVIRRVMRSRAARQELAEQRLEPRPEHVQSNREAVERGFSLGAYGQRLMAVYRALLESSVEPVVALKAEGLLEQFLAPERLFLLRT